MNAKKVKTDMVSHLIKNGITEIHELWGYAKTYAMGGSYTSSGDFISVILVKGKQRCKFSISLKEVQ